MRLDFRNKGITALLGGGAFVALALVILAAVPSTPAGRARGQDMTGPEMTDFKAQLENHDPPNEAQIKTLLEGARAQPRSGEIWITEARLKTFRTNGALEMQADAPRCVFDSVQHTVSSSGPLQIRTPDQRFYLEGEGFILVQTNSVLIVSNHVHTIIRNNSSKLRSKP